MSGKPLRPDEQIAGIESLLTVVGGRVAYAAGDYSGMDETLPPVSPAWSPVDRFGGFRAQSGRGYSQAEALLVVAAAADEQRAWRTTRGDLDRARLPIPTDPCLEP